MMLSEGLLLVPVPGMEQTACGHREGAARRGMEMQPQHSPWGQGKVWMLSPVPWKPNELRTHQPALSGGGRLRDPRQVGTHRGDAMIVFGIEEGCRNAPEWCCQGNWVLGKVSSG